MLQSSEWLILDISSFLIVEQFYSLSWVDIISKNSTYKQ